MTADDLVIVDLADEVAELRERLAVAAAYRAMVQVALEQLAEQRAELSYSRRRIAALVDEVRAIRGAVAA